MRIGRILIIMGLTMIVMGFITVMVHGSNSTSTSTSSKNMTLDCIRMFYSDSWNKGYVESLAEYCNTKK
jgi:hypothetical protein